MAATWTVPLVTDTEAEQAISGAALAVEVLHLAGNDPIWFTIGSGAPPAIAATVVVEGADANVVMPGQSIILPTTDDIFTMKFRTASPAKVHIVLVTA